MQGFKKQITLSKNSRGCWVLDTTKGCSGCNSDRPHGCYDNCYAQNIAARYGRDFSSIVKRDFLKDESQLRLFDFDDALHTSAILRAIKKVDMPFIRVGELGDPSDDWEHTLKVCKIISTAGKLIVLITKHWEAIPEYMLSSLKNLCINTSISALDSEVEIEHRLNQYYRLQKHCKSVLRVVSCDFNTQGVEGGRRAIVQDELFKVGRIINTVFRPTENNRLVTDGVINTRRVQFLRSTMLASVYDENAYFGFCPECPDMCGLSV